MNKIECPYCESSFNGLYEEEVIWLMEHIEHNHALEDLPSGDGAGVTPPKSKHGQVKFARRIG